MAAHTAFVPHLHTCEVDGLEHWYVRMETQEGWFDSMSEPKVSKKLAASDLRRIRQEMAKLWFATYQPTPPSTRSGN